MNFTSPRDAFVAELQRLNIPLNTTGIGEILQSFDSGSLGASYGTNRGPYSSFNGLLYDRIAARFYTVYAWQIGVAASHPTDAQREQRKTKNREIKMLATTDGKREVRAV